MARVQDQLGHPLESIDLFKQVLIYDVCNLESVAYIAGYHFDSQHPEISFKLFERLHLIGLNSP
jgi:hypothetical protein